MTVVDLPKQCSVYRFFNASGVLLYLGITVKGSERFKGHAKEKPWWPEVASTTVEHFDTREQAREMELFAIEYEQPLYNRADRKPPPQMASGIREMHPTEDFVVAVEDLVDRLLDLARDLDTIEGFTDTGKAQLATALAALRGLADAERASL